MAARGEPATGAPALGEWLDHMVRRPGYACTLRLDGVTTTAAEAAARSRQLAAGLIARGVRPGDRVAVVMRASTEVLDVWFGLARTGAVEVPLNPDSGRELLAYYLEHCGATLAICDAELASVVLDCAPAGLTRLLVHGPGPAASAVTVIENLSDVPQQPGELPVVKGSDPAVILYTSGTTGPPKGVLLSHRANLNLARHTVDLMGYTPADRLYSVFPLFHSNARFCSVLAAIEAGCDLVLDRKFSASRFWQICRDNAITAFNYQGAMMSILFGQPEHPDDRDNPVRVAFGAPCPAEIFTAFEQRFDVQLTEIFGSTEVSIITDMPPAARRIGTAGRESANYEVAVVDEYDQAVPAGEAGEIVTRPKRPGWMFDGYHGMPAETAASWRNLWFHTGDRGRLDADGYLTFLDRLKDTVRRRGENVSTWEIERVVTGYPGVLAAAAYGVPSALSEEDVMVAVVAAPGHHLNQADLPQLHGYCRRRLTPFAVPRYLRIVDDLPVTPSQRVKKYLLREDGVTATTWDAESIGAPAAGPAGVRDA